MATAGKPITCRAAVVWNVGEPFVIENVEVAVPQRGELRLKLISAGLCHSDLQINEGFNPDWYFPAVLGHEGAGIVESIGEGVTSIKPGDAVITIFESYCGECDYCTDSRTNLCRKTRRDCNWQMDGTSRISCKGKILSQMSSVSTFSEYTVTSEYHVAKINSKANLKDLCLASCCLPTGYGAVMNVGKVPPGATCAIWGLGGNGMCAVMGCRDSGASKIIGLDTNPRKFALAKTLGCSEFINPDEVDDVAKKLSEMTNGGVDFCFVAVGHIPAMEQAFQSSHPAWGKTVIIGEAPNGEKMSAGIWELLYGRQLVGTYYGLYRAKLAIPKLVEEVLAGQIQLEKLISHRIPLDKINEGYAMLTSGESLRTVINFDLTV